MRSNGATSARMGDVALTLGPPIASVVVQQPGPTPPESDDDADRRELETLLASSGADVDLVLEQMKRAKERAVL